MYKYIQEIWSLCMEQSLNIIKMKNSKKALITLAGLAMVGAGTVSFAGQLPGSKPAVTGNCKDITASNSTEFHGNPIDSSLNLAMAGNQWVVFNKVLSRFNERRIMKGTLKPDQDADLDHKGAWTRDELQAERNRYFVELIPPGKERAQIISGCMILGNEKDTNFLPLNLQVDFDVFTSTNYDETKLLAAKGFLSTALPYTKNQLTLMVKEGNPEGFASGPATDTTVAATLDLLSPAFRVSEVDHVDEGIHKAINGMYKKMDAYVRTNGSPAEVAALDAALELVKTPQDGSPGCSRYDACGTTTNTYPTVFDLWNSPECHVGTEGTAGAHLRMCEFAILNKANTHETRVHHVETPSGILGKATYAPVDVGPVWVSELQFALAAGDEVEGVQPPDSVNGPKVYSIGLLASTGGGRQSVANEFIDFMVEPGNGVTGDGIGDAQDEYVAGGFNPMTCQDFAKGEFYSLDKNGDLVTTPRDVTASCP